MALPNSTQGFVRLRWLAKAQAEGARLRKWLPEEMISLRPEATASVCRAYLEHGMQQLPQPVKLYYMGPMFRRERPQKGRYRQFYQIGAEVLGGSDAPAIDAEVIEMVMTFFDRLELQGVQLDINSIGCRECRPKYVDTAACRAPQSEGQARAGQPAAHRNESAACARFQTGKRTAHYRQAAARRRSPVRGLREALRRRKASARNAWRALPRELAPGPRPRLLHAHDL